MYLSKPLTKIPDGIRTPRPKSVQFAEPGSSPERHRSRPRDSLNPEDERIRNAHEAELSSADGERKRRRRRRRRHRDREGHESGSDYPTSSPEEERHERDRGNGDRERSRDRDRKREGKRRSRSVDEEVRPRAARKGTSESVQSDSTEDLPPRFDEQGRKVAQEEGGDPMMEKINDILAGKGTAGGIFRRLMGDGDGRRR